MPCIVRSARGGRETRSSGLTWSAMVLSGSTCLSLRSGFGLSHVCRLQSRCHSHSGGGGARRTKEKARDSFNVMFVLPAPPRGGSVGGLQRQAHTPASPFGRAGGFPTRQRKVRKPPVCQNACPPPPPPPRLSGQQSVPV